VNARMYGLVNKGRPGLDASIERAAGDQPVNLADGKPSGKPQDRMAYRVLIVDDHPYARRAIRSLLEADPAFTVAGEAESGEEALELCGELHPDVVLMDIRMPGMGGLEATRQLKRLYPYLRIVMLTVSDAASDLFTALQFGAQGYLLKNMKPEEWSGYLHALLDENAEGSRLIADRLIRQFQERPKDVFVRDAAGVRAEAEGAAQTDPSPDALTSREREIAAFIAQGRTNREISRQLNISEHTVKNHIKNMLHKLSLDNRVNLAAYAIRHGLSYIRHKNKEK